jgi:hypothetical protein
MHPLGGSIFRSRARLPVASGYFGANALARDRGSELNAGLKAEGCLSHIFINCQRQGVKMPPINYRHWNSERLELPILLNN